MYQLSRVLSRLFLPVTLSRHRQGDYKRQRNKDLFQVKCISTMKISLESEYYFANNSAPDPRTR